MKKKELEKRSVGRPKLADEKLMKEAKRQIYLVLVLLLVIISLSGLRLMSGIMPIGSLNNASNNKLAFSLFGPSISINVSGTERQKVGYGAANVVADTYPSSDTVTWTSSNTSVVSIIVGSNPKIITFYVVGVGTSKITATSSSGKSDSFTIIGVDNTITTSSSIKLNTTGTITRKVGYSPLFNITATTTPSSDTVTWTSSNTNVATISVAILSNKKMRYKVVGVGEATITATSSSGATASFKIIGEGSTTINPSTSISLNVTGTVTYPKGTIYGAIVATTNPANETVTWKSSSSSIIKIIQLESSNKVNISFVGTGKSTITAKSSSGKTASFTAVSTGTSSTTPTISIDKSGTLTHKVGYSPLFNITATTTPSSDKVTWSSSNANVATISVSLLSSKKMKYKVIGVGETTITATSSSGKTASFKVVGEGSTPPPTQPSKISLNKSGEETYNVGTIVGPVIATTTPSSQTVKWTSSNNNILTIIPSSNPKQIDVKVVGVGKASILATTGDESTDGFSIIGKEVIATPTDTWFWPMEKSPSFITQVYKTGHLAIDISYPGCSGSPMYAAKAGVVIESSYGQTQGYYLIIDHQDGYKTTYMHILSGTKLVSTGNTVAKGQRIASVGSTGNSTGAHLHFVVTRTSDGQKLNACSDSVFGKCYQYCRWSSGAKINSGC